jgi:hypothetical protein
LRQRESLGLTDVEQVLTKGDIAGAASVGMVGLQSSAIAMAVPPERSRLAGWTFILIAIIRPGIGAVTRRKARKMQALNERIATPKGGTGRHRSWQIPTAEDPRFLIAYSLVPGSC